MFIKYLTIVSVIGLAYEALGPGEIYIFKYTNGIGILKKPENVLRTKLQNTIFYRT